MSAQEDFDKSVAGDVVVVVGYGSVTVIGVAGVGAVVDGATVVGVYCKYKHHHDVVV